MLSKTLLSILIALLLISSMLSAAYSLWNDELKANVKVSTGDLELKFVCYKIVTCGCCCNTPSNYSATGEIVNGGKEFRASFENVYPHWKAVILLSIQNVGTVPAKLTKIRTVVSGDDELLKLFHYRTCVLGPYVLNVKKSPYWARACNIHGIRCFKTLVLDPGEKALVVVPLGIDGFVNSSKLNMRITFDFTSSW